MNKLENSDSACSVCGHPAGHSPDCIFFNAVPNRILFDNEKIKTGDKIIKTALWVTAFDFDFYANVNLDRKQVHFSGDLAEKIGFIKHVEIDKALRGEGIGGLLLSNLEEQLAKRGIKTIYAGFFSTRTVNFFLQNGYEIVPIKSIDQETIDNWSMGVSDFDERVDSEQTFNRLKETEGNKFKKILLRKKLLS